MSGDFYIHYVEGRDFFPPTERYLVLKKNNKIIVVSVSDIRSWDESYDIIEWLYLDHQINEFIEYNKEILIEKYKISEIEIDTRYKKFNRKINLTDYI